MIKFEMNVAMPEGNKRNKYPWEAMPINASFQVPGNIHSKNAYTLTSVANGKYNPKKWETRPYGDGFRIWRVA